MQIKLKFSLILQAEYDNLLIYRWSHRQTQTIAGSTLQFSSTRSIYYFKLNYKSIVYQK